MFRATPMLPRVLLHTLAVVKREFVLDSANGGQSRPVYKAAKTFRGVVMPVSNKDWQQLPEGTFTSNSQKLYTDDAVDIEPGDIIRDTYDGQQYSVITELNHNTIHPLLRFLVEGVDSE